MSTWMTAEEHFLSWAHELNSNSVPSPLIAPVCDVPADMGSQGTDTLAYIFPGQLEHNTPLVLLCVSGPCL